MADEQLLLDDGEIKLRAAIGYKLAVASENLARSNTTQVRFPKVGGFDIRSICLGSTNSLMSSVPSYGRVMRQPR